MSKGIVLTVSNSSHDNSIVLTGQGLTIENVVGGARFNAKIAITEDPEILQRVEAAHTYIVKAAAAGKAIYGVTTGFGGMAHTTISPQEAGELQENLLWFLKSEAGQPLSREDVRAAMLIRVNSHLKGLSGLRLELVRRIVTFLNHGVTPHLREFGSIGASGDLIPLAGIGGALIGLDECFTVDFDGQTMDSITALNKLGLPRLKLQPKEGLAMVNGTAVMSGIAALCVYDAQILLALAMGVHALAMQALQGSRQPLHPFIHGHKPHPGQVWAAETLLDLLQGSVLVPDESKDRRTPVSGELIQDRYSLRCLPQYLGPLVDGLIQVSRYVTVEINSATDNPLIDPENQRDYHGGNFLGQYIGVGMDHLRYYLGLMAKHLDAQIALLTAPEFNKGLPASLVGNPQRKVNMGLKGLQLCGNSIMPMLTFLGNSLVDRFPTHAEQFNQNINSLGVGSATLARQSIAALQQYLALGLIFGVQAVELRTCSATGHYDARRCLSPKTLNLYEAVYRVLKRQPDPQRPLIRNDNEQPLARYIRSLAADIAACGQVPQSLHDVASGVVR